MSNEHITFTNNSAKVKSRMKEVAIVFLLECGGELQAQTARNTKVKSGDTKGSWQYKVDEDNLMVYIGSDYDNAIWEEYGTGEYALEGNGRKGGWAYKDAGGVWHFTHGKKPRRAFFNTYMSIKSKIIREAENRFRGL